MAKMAVIRTGGQQFLVKPEEVIIVQKLNNNVDDTIELETLGIFDEEGAEVEVGTPVLKKNVTATVIEHMKGDKVRVSKFKAKVRYRRTNGFRAELTKIKIQSI
jgi:large subunit ribosomal protein L21